MARPRKTRDTKLSRQIIFRLSEEEYLRLQAQAVRAGLRPGQLARMLVRKRQQRIVIETVTRFDPAYINQLSRMGNLLNQLTHNSHIFRRVSPKLDRLCDDIRNLVFEAVEERVEE